MNRSKESCWLLRYSQIWYGCVFILKGRVGKDLDIGNSFDNIFDIFGRCITSIDNKDYLIKFF